MYFEKKAGKTKLSTRSGKTCTQQLRTTFNTKNHDVKVETLGTGKSMTLVQRKNINEKVMEYNTTVEKPLKSNK